MISGRYNQRNADGTLIEHTEKSPQAFARLCFEAMGQGKFDVSQLPDDAARYRVGQSPRQRKRCRIFASCSGVASRRDFGTSPGL